MFTYKIAKNPYGEANSVLRSDGWQIPFDPANSDYQEYLKWIEVGNTPLAADEVA